MRASGHVLVTGGAGFIGSHLVEHLLAESIRVVVIDDCSTGTLANLESASKDPNLTVIESKVSECKDLDQITSEASAVYHLAAAVGVELVVNSPIRTIRTNLDETEAILESASRSGTPVLLTSTSEVYGKSSRHAFSEDDDLVIGPPSLGRWSYACSKLMDEFLALAYAREKGLPVVVARLFNTVGPRQTGRYGMVLPRSIEAARSGTPLKIFGDGTQTRCFCAVEDAVEGLLRLQGQPAACGGVFNVGSEDEISILDLAKLVIGFFGSRSAIEFVPYSVAYAPGFEDMMRRRPLVEKLWKTTGFKPRTSLEEILGRFEGRSRK